MKNGKSMGVPARAMMVRKAAAKQGTRYAMDRVALSRSKGKASAISTDGRLMIRAQWDSEGDDLPESLLFATMADRIATAFPEGIEMTVGEDGTPNLSAQGELSFSTKLELSGKYKDKKPEFPDCSSIFPKFSRIRGDGKGAVTIRMNPALFSRAVNAIAKMIGNAEERGVTMEISDDPNRLMSITGSGNGITVTALLTPMRTEEATK